MFVWHIFQHSPRLYYRNKNIGIIHLWFLSCVGFGIPNCVLRGICQNVNKVWWNLKRASYICLMLNSNKCGVLILSTVETVPPSAYFSSQVQFDSPQWSCFRNKWTLLTTFNVSSAYYGLSFCLPVLLLLLLLQSLDPIIIYSLYLSKRSIQNSGRCIGRTR